ncbi:MAG TPA: TOBE domain-containing protein, partial [bacterium]|nr:TOBE domain-containing protein [bacterium]
FLEARLMQQDGTLIVDADVFRTEVPAAAAPQLAGLVGKPVIFGIRPEDIHDSAFHQSIVNGSVFKATVDVHEPLGSDIILYLTAGKHSLVARVDARSQARMGQTTEVMMDTAKMHLFNAETHEAVL